MSRIDPHRLRDELRNLGLVKGDIVYVKADLLHIGMIKGDLRTGFLNALLDVVGDEGTIITAAYTKTYFFPSFFKEKKVFSKDTIPNTGALAKLMLEHPEARRSSHPTNSYVAIGKYANELTLAHNHTQSSYEPMRTVMNLDGKCVIIGCIDSNPGHTTTHLAQYDLGFAMQNNFRGFVGATYKEKGKLKVFFRRDFGGHNGGARKIYSQYLDKGILTLSRVGNTTAILSKAKEAYDIDIKLLLENKKLILCSSPTCFSCRVSWRYNLQDIPKFIVATLLTKIFKLGKKLYVKNFK